jgi:hypothetical protein
MSDDARPCDVHELPYCGLCQQTTGNYQRGRVRLNVPPGHYVEIRGGKGVYHHPDCYNVTGEWDGGDAATLGERLVRSPEDIRASRIRPAACCSPPTVR